MGQEKKHMKFCTMKSEVLGRNNPMHQSRLGTEWLKRSCIEKGMGALEGNWNVTHRVPLIGSGHQHHELH